MYHEVKQRHVDGIIRNILQIVGDCASNKFRKPVDMLRKYSYNTCVQNCQMNIDELKTRLVNEWAQFDQSIIDDAISQRRRSLGACIHARGAHFEHKFWQKLSKSVEIWCSSDKNKSA